MVNKSSRTRSKNNLTIALHKAANRSSRTRSKIQDRAIIIYATRSSEHKSNFTFQVRIRRVYENAHRVSEDITLQYRESMSIRVSITPSKRLRSSLLMFSFLHMTRERERDVQVLDPKGLVNEYLGTQDLDTHKALNLS
jgi:hypothetical protein